MSEPPSDFCHVSVKCTFAIFLRLMAIKHQSKRNLIGSNHPTFLEKRHLLVSCSCKWSLPESQKGTLLDCSFSAPTKRNTNLRCAAAGHKLKQ